MVDQQTTHTQIELKIKVYNGLLRTAGIIETIAKKVKQGVTININKQNACV